MDFNQCLIDAAIVLFSTSFIEAMLLLLSILLDILDFGYHIQKIFDWAKEKYRNHKRSK